MLSSTFSGGAVSKAWLRMLADIGIGSAIKTALTHTDGKWSPRPSRSCTTAQSLPVWGWNASAVGLRVPAANVVGLDLSASKRWIVALGSGSTPMFPDEPTPTLRGVAAVVATRWNSRVSAAEARSVKHQGMGDILF